MNRQLPAVLSNSPHSESKSCTKRISLAHTVHDITVRVRGEKKTTGIEGIQTDKTETHQHTQNFAERKKTKKKMTKVKAS